MATRITDDFNRADNADLGAAWDVVGGATAFHITSNQAIPASFGGSDSYEIYTGAGAIANDQWARADLTCVGTSGSGAGVALLVRVTAGDRDGYRLCCDHAATNNVMIDRHTDGGSTYIQKILITRAWSDGDTFEFQVRGGTGAVRLTVIHNGTVVIDTVDTDAATSQVLSGYPGISFSTSETSALIDNFTAGDFLDIVRTASPVTVALSASSTSTTKTATPITVSLSAGQTAVPVADVANPGSWTDQDGGTTDLHTPLTAIDASYDQSPSAPASAGVTVTMGTLSTPLSGTRTLTLRVQKSDASGQIDLIVNLRDSAGTLIQSFSGGSLDNIPAADTPIILTVTNGIGSYTGLRVEMIANQSA